MVKNQMLESKVKEIMDKTNSGHYNWTSRKDSYYFDENTLFVVFSQEFYDGVKEKKYSLLLMITPAGTKTLYNEIYFFSDQNYENFDQCITRILGAEKENEKIKVSVKTVSGKEKTFIV